MWFHVRQLQEMLAIYDSINSVGEILLVNNDNTKTPELNYNKVRLIGDGKNIYVNKAWKLGVKEAKFDKVVLVNDDLTIQGDVNSLFELVSFLLKDGVIIGVGEKCYSGKVSKIKFVERPIENKKDMGWGFGVFMFLTKNTFLNTPIPDNILVWYGDHILYYSNKAWSFEGVNIITSMKGTTSKINLTGFAKREKLAFQKYLRLNK